MASRKRDQKTELQSAREATLARVQAFQEEDETLSAAINYAKDLLGAQPSDSSVIAEYTNIRGNKVLIKLRFPNGQLREIRFNIADIPAHHFPPVPIDLDPITEEMEEELLAEAEETKQQTSGEVQEKVEKRETGGKIKKSTKPVISTKVSAHTSKTPKTVRTSAAVKAKAVAPKKTIKESVAEKSKIMPKPVDVMQETVPTPGPSGTITVPDAIKAYVDAQLATVATDLKTAREENETLKQRLQQMEQLREKERLERQEELNLERQRQIMAEQREEQRLQDDLVRFQRDRERELEEARIERDQQRDREDQRRDREDQRQDRDRNGVHHRGNRVSTSSNDQLNIIEPDATSHNSNIVNETVTLESVDKGEEKKETEKDDREILTNPLEIETESTANYETTEKGLVMKALGKIVDRLERTNETATIRDNNLIEKDTTKFEYFLTTKKNNYNTWYSLFQTEINLKRLDDIIDETVTPYRAFSGTENQARKRIVRGIILAHIDEIYQEQVLDLGEPLLMLEKLHKLKRDEINDTTVSIKDQFRQLTFKMGHETVHDFNLKFDELVRKYQVVAGEPMNELDKRDAYYHIVAKVIPSIKEATYRDVAKGIGDGYTFEEMRRYVQKYEAENKSLLQGRGRAGLMVTMRQQQSQPLDRCFNCGANGHRAPACPRSVGEYIATLKHKGAMSTPHQK